MLRSKIMTLILALILVNSLALESQRPFFLIGHMVNGINQVDKFLALNCNVLELDIQFHPDGSVDKVFHDFPCDLGRNCNDSTSLDQYLEYIQMMADPRTYKGYHEKLVMLFFDLKLGRSGNKTRSGEDVARHLVDYLWIDEQSQVKVLMDIQNEINKDFILGFIDHLDQLEFSPRLKDAGFDSGVGNLDEKRTMFEMLNSSDYSVNVWQGDGITNVLRGIHRKGKLERLVSVRDSPSGFFHKVYDWTVDKKPIMRNSLRLGVDGIITNDPKSLSEVLEEPEFKNSFRVATINDNPFVRFGG